MQKLLVNIYEAIRSRLCERRNTHQVKVNRFATISKTDILVRKTKYQLSTHNNHQQQKIKKVDQNNLKMIDHIDEIDYHNNMSNNKHQQSYRDDKQQQQLRQQELGYPELQSSIGDGITRVKESQYKVNLLPLDEQQNSHHSQQQHQMLQHRDQSSQSPHQQQQKQQQEQTTQQQRQFLIQQQIQIDHFERQLQQILQKFSLIQHNENNNNKTFWRRQYSREGKKWKLNQDEVDGVVKNHNNSSKDSQLQLQQSQSLYAQNQQKDALIPQPLLQRLYTQDITQIRQFKYPRQLTTDYPPISIQTYKNIRQLWLLGTSHPNYIIKQMTLSYLSKLNARSFSTLNIGKWLNDEIINSYLQMIDNSCVQKKAGYRVLNSFFAETTFVKSPQVIQRVFKRKNITKKNVTIIAVNTGKHWLFVQVINQKIIIHDSIRQKLQWYETSNTFGPKFANIKKFARVIYGLNEPIVVLDENFPQQDNGYDCGMFLLCGIKDIVREYREWSFYQQDINYKRVQVANELLNQKLDSFRNN